MEADKAHELYVQLQRFDAGARFKQGIGFAGNGASVQLPGGYTEQGDDDVVARNRRIRAALYPGLEEQEERDKGYDSDTAEAVQRRLAELRQESEGGRARPAARLYDERLERQQLQRQQLRGRSKHTNRSRSRSQERRRRRERRRSRSRSRSRSRRRGHHRSRSRSRGRRRRSRSRSRSTERRACHNSSMLRQRSRSRGRGWSPGSKAVGGGVQVAGVGPGAAAGLQRYDFEALIPGYAAMSAPQRLRAKTQYLLERSTAQDQRRERSRQEGGHASHAGGDQWTRFRFDASAELEEQRAPPMTAGLGVAGLGSGAGGGDSDGDTAAGLLGAFNFSSVTFQQSSAAAVQQERNESHAAAIFGGGSGAAGKAAGKEAQARAAGRSIKSGEGDAPMGRVEAQAAAAAGVNRDLPYLLAIAEEEGVVVVPPEELAAGGGSAAQQATQQKQAGAGGSGTASWRERALAARQGRRQ
ncbi:hypothetical protein D9Q98_001126 [Chlorella vulgaris]|uniref:Uncharacterized protein n=1 Tax=Chlorella vulgaris TaxID=3077 RepID=A0A9D4U0Y4_CHLVU|nr:hypothetical protein D9Q98_001126 [Chlorella vulgaris]